jgi:transposase
MPDLPIPRGRAGAGLIAHVLTAKYCDHQPLHRQAEQYAREDVNLSRSTLADMVGQAARLPDERLRVRLERTAPLLMEMKTWLETTLRRRPRMNESPEVAQASI